MNDKTKISHLLCLGVPLEIRANLETALSFFQIAATFPSISSSLAEIHARMAKPDSAVGVWSHIPGVKIQSYLDANIALFRIASGSVWQAAPEKTVTNLSGLIPCAFFLERITQADQYDNAPGEGPLHLEAVYRPPADQFLPSDTESGSKAFSYRLAPEETPEAVLLNQGRLLGSTVIVPALTPAVFSAKQENNSTLVKLLRRARSISPDAVTIVTNSLFAGTAALAGTRQYEGIIVDSLDIPYTSDLLESVSHVVTDSYWIALDCRANDTPVEFIADIIFDVSITSNDALDVVKTLNRICCKVVQPVEQVMESPETVTTTTETIAAYRKTPPYRKQKVYKKYPDGTVPPWLLAAQDDMPKEGFFAYIPWIREHSDALMEIVKGQTKTPIVPLHLINDVRNDASRKGAMSYSLNQPEALRKLVFSRLTTLKREIKGVLFSFDWHPYMRVISQACADLGIPRILIPHESVFAKQSMYYVDATTGIDRPNADLVLAWGKLQQDVFENRRFPADRIEPVGAPKFDIYRSKKGAALKREHYCNVFGLDEFKKIILFSAQPLDSQYDAEVARVAQQTAMLDIFEIAQKNDWQLIVRTPPSRFSDVVGEALRTKISESSHAVIDQSGFYCVSPFEALQNCDVAISINSTMLFEALLLGKPAISAKYIEFESFWAKTSIQFARNRDEIQEWLTKALVDQTFPAPDLAWAEVYLSNGAFDGNAAQRIGVILDQIASGAREVTIFRPDESVVMDAKTQAGNIAVPDMRSVGNMHKYLTTLVGADNVETPASNPELFAYDHYLRWGLHTTRAKLKLDMMTREMGMKPIYVEDGFIRSPGLGLHGDPGLSVILDDVTPYYDATKNSRLQEILNSNFKLTKDQQKRADALMKKIIRHKITKYNHAPVRNLSGMRKGRKAVALIDQRFGDQSITSGLADSQTFVRMIRQAQALGPSVDIFIKIHPDAITGGKSSYLADPKFSMFHEEANVHLIKEDVNPHSLLEAVDEVWVATSGMGFEALIAGKSVKCFGAPFYAGRGVTSDDVPLPTRTKKRSVAEMFYVAYILLSRYVDPRVNARCEIETMLEYMIETSLGVEP